MDKVNVRAMNKGSPGPATYLPTYKPPTRHCRIAGSVKNCYDYKPGTTSPGPGKYFPPQKLSIGKPQFTKIGREARITGVTDKVARPNDPGPGQYNPLGCKPLGVAGIQGFMTGTPYKDGRPISNQKDITVPCPTKYNPKNNFNDTFSIKGGKTTFGTGDRFASNVSTY